MNKHIKLILFDIFMAILIVVLYSPGLVGLSPRNPGILRPGLAIICAIFIATAVIWVNMNALKKVSEKDFRQLDVERGTADQAIHVMEKYSKADLVGPIAQSAKAQLESAQTKQAALHSIIGRKFPKGSLSYDKFASAVDAAVATIVKNNLILANRIQTFDVKDYRRTEQLIASGSYRKDNVPDEIQEERAQVHASNKETLDAIVTANEKLLLELDKFSSEVGKMDVDDATGANDAMVQEIRELIEQTKYYE